MAAAYRRRLANPAVAGKDRSMMTPEQHAARARKLTDEADQLYNLIENTLDSSPVEAQDWKILHARIDLARLHAELAKLPAPAAPAPSSYPDPAGTLRGQARTRTANPNPSGFVPTYEVLDDLDE
jgi:hypothetical protein